MTQTTAARTTVGAMGNLSLDELRQAQAETLARPRRRYGLAARLLFRLMDAVYGPGRNLRKFKVLELIARVPYQAWEQVAYVAITHTASRTSFARRIFDRVNEARAQEDNEQWHLLILQELIDHEGRREGLLRYRLLPQAIAFVYYQLSWFLYAIRPRWSYRLNADFEDHAEHEYMQFVAENPVFERRPFTSAFSADYRALPTLADLFRQIGYDERVHMRESEARMREARFR